MKARKVFNDYSNQNKSIKLHIGSGRNYKEGWLNIDIASKAHKDLTYDITKGLPFPDNSVDIIFNEHVIEHLSYDEALFFLKESFRTLKPYGVIRTAFPDLDVLTDSYLKDSWREMEWVKLIKAEWYPSGCYMLNECIREKGGHKYMYTVSELARRLQEAGFIKDNITTCIVGQSAFPNLINAEKRADSSAVGTVK